MNKNLNLIVVIALSVLLALVLMVIPLPERLFHFRPDWLALVLIYWALATPDRVGATVGFFLGLLMDVLLVKTFGLNALGMCAIGFAASAMHTQIRTLSIWRQAITVGVMIAIMKLLIGWVSGMISQFEMTLYYWYSILSDMLIWPWIYIISRNIRRALRIN